jgi:hypothetical protein
MKRLINGAVLVFISGPAWPGAHAAPIPVGFLSWDVTIPGSFGQFDITNLTGQNASPPDFPVDTQVQFTSLSLVVDFSDGSMTTFGPPYFTLNPDGESLDGSPIAIGGMSPQPVSATLTGDLTPTTIDVSGTPTVVDASFDATTVANSPVLINGDSAVINAEPAMAPVPAPLVGFGLPSFLAIGGLWFGAKSWERRRGMLGRSRCRHKSAKAPAHSRFAGGLLPFLAVAAILFPAFSFASTTLKQSNASSPGSGVAGVSFVNITASGFPSGPINPANVTIRLAPTCPVGAMSPVAGEADATATGIRTILGSTDRVNFEVPSTLLSGAPIPQGTYMAQIVDTTDGFAGGNCSIVTITNTNTALNACVPSSSMGIVAGNTVTAYVPKANWGSNSNTGIGAVVIEPTLGGSSAAIDTASPVNACAGNPATGQVVCTGDDTSVYLITGANLTNTLTSDLTGDALFSGGGCQNCGVAINALTNTAAIVGGAPLTLAGAHDAVQILNLSNNKFQPLFRMQKPVSEDISIDAGRNLILSPNENSGPPSFGPGGYVLLSTDPMTGTVTGEFDRAIGIGEPDAAAEDCSTGIALSTDERGGADIYLADLSQSTFTPGNPAGSWTSPSTIFIFTGNSIGFAATGISVAQGSSHLAFATLEADVIGVFGIMQLQSASGTGGAAPTVEDWVVGLMPPMPDGASFAGGCDPHTVTTYTSPNTGKAIGLVAGYSFQCNSPPTFVGVIDMAAALAAPREAAPNDHQIDPSVDLIMTGIVKYVAVP